MDRVILHCDCNGFFASVEMLSDPSLKNVPMAVAGDPENRHGIILAKNELAKKYGVATAETIHQAKEKCPGLVLVPPHHRKYLEISKAVNKIYLDYTDMVDPFGIDESFLDLTGSMKLLGKSPAGIADDIRRRVREEIGITISVGVSFCRVFAKLGSDYKKPDATTVMDRENYKEIAYPLPVSDLLFVGRQTEKELRAMGILTIGQLAAADRLALTKRLGEAGDTLWRSANGLDNEPVRSYFADREPPKSVGNGMTFRRDITGEAEIRSGIMTLVDSVAARLRNENMKCTVLQVQIKDPNFHTVQKQTKLRRPTWLRQDLTNTAVSLVREAVGFGNSIRSITVTAASLVPADGEGGQLSFFEEEADTGKQEQVEDAMQDIRRRFGKHSIKLGCYREDGLGIEEKKGKNGET